MKRNLKEISSRPLRILEVGCGTGSATRFIHASFPKALITAIDLSESYIEYARFRFKGERRINFVNENAEGLPYKNEYFDAVVSVFLFHELPKAVRKKVLSECIRVLKPGGFIGFVDSIQENDRPEFNEALKDFPKNYHEPFYRDYTKDPMEKWLKKTQFPKTGCEFGFFSKVVWGNKATK
jgi:ubiquinone/menaquinone biosynthesis C-methylase UbiE